MKTQKIESAVPHFTKRVLQSYFGLLSNCRNKSVWMIAESFIKMEKNYYFFYKLKCISGFWIWCNPYLRDLIFTFIGLCLQRLYFTFHFVLFNCSVARIVLIISSIITDGKRNSDKIKYVCVLSARNTTSVAGNEWMHVTICWIHFHYVCHWHAYSFSMDIHLFIYFFFLI